MSFLCFVGGCLGGFLKAILPSVLQITYLSKFRGLVSYGEYTCKICPTADLIRNCRGILKKSGEGSGMWCGEHQCEESFGSGDWVYKWIMERNNSPIFPMQLSFGTWGNPRGTFLQGVQVHFSLQRTVDIAAASAGLVGHGDTYEQLSETVWALQGKFLV